MEYNVERICRQIVTESGDAILFADVDGIIRLWNRGATRIFGFEREEAVGKSLDLIVPDKLRPRHWEGYHRAMATGTTRYADDKLAVPAQKKDENRVSMEFTVVVVKDEDGAVAGVAAVMRDVTARWEREKELKERLAILESASP